MPRSCRSRSSFHDQLAPPGVFRKFLPSSFFLLHHGYGLVRAFLRADAITFAEIVIYPRRSRFGNRRLGTVHPADVASRFRALHQDTRILIKDGLESAPRACLATFTFGRMLDGRDG